VKTRRQNQNEEDQTQALDKTSNFMEAAILVEREFIQ
jgi:hypothetical protein